MKHTAIAGQSTDVRSEGWRQASPDTVAPFSAVAYLFARELYQRYHIPIGLIQSTWGGTGAEAWMSRSALQPFPEFRAAITSQAQVNSDTLAQAERYLKEKNEWYRAHGSDDRGRRGYQDVWADLNFDVRSWPTVWVPQDWDRECDKGHFMGPVWFRRDILVPPERGGRNLTLRLGTLIKDAEVYFNGMRLGETHATYPNQTVVYSVPGGKVLAGPNTVAVRLVGNPDAECAVMLGPANEMNAETGATQISLAGTWSYQPGPDVREFPTPSPSVLAVTDRYAPSALFNGMIEPLTSFRVKGVIWYQGENNTDRARQYQTLFPALIQDWRRHWKYDFPFLFVQLAGFGHNEPEPAEYPWADLRQAQCMALSVPHTAMATAVDVGDEGDIHPKDKLDVAHRLALAAAKLAYGEQLTSSGPRFQSMSVEGSAIRIRFSGSHSGVVVRDKYGYARGFEIASADGPFRWAEAHQDPGGEDIIVSAASVHAPVAVRYDWSNTPDGNVYNADGLPLLPFRTDAPCP